MFTAGLNPNLTLGCDAPQRPINLFYGHILCLSRTIYSFSVGIQAEYMVELYLLSILFAITDWDCDGQQELLLKMRGKHTW